jgi:hypothetical protein
MFQLEQMYWTPEEEGIQALAAAAGIVPGAPLEEEAIAAPEGEAILWHLPVGAPGPVPADSPPVTNGVSMDYEGELSALLEAAWAKFDTPPPSPDPPF